LAPTEATQLYLTANYNKQFHFAATLLDVMLRYFNLNTALAFLLRLFSFTPGARAIKADVKETRGRSANWRLMT
jgi:hypothetical protein